MRDVKSIERIARVVVASFYYVCAAILPRESVLAGPFVAIHQVMHAVPWVIVVALFGLTVLLATRCESVLVAWGILLVVPLAWLAVGCFLGAVFSV